MRAAGLAALLAAQLAAPTVAVMVQTPSGTVEGFTVEGVPAKGAGADGPGVPRGAVEAFLGVPFAAPPVGELRWHSPRPIAPWTGTKVYKPRRSSRLCTRRGIFPLKRLSL